MFFQHFLMMVFLWSLLSRFQLKKIEKDPIIYQHSEEEKNCPGDVGAEGDVGARQLWCTTRCMKKIPR